MNDAASAHRPVVERWRRYGNDRVYVRLPDGADIGWWDLQNDEPHP